MANSEMKAPPAPSRELNELIGVWLQGAAVNAAAGRHTLYNEATYPVLRAREVEIVQGLTELGVKFTLQPSRLSRLLLLTIHGTPHVAAALGQLNRQDADNRQDAKSAKDAEVQRK